MDGKSYLSRIKLKGFFMSSEPLQSRKRETAYKISISDIVNGKFIKIDNKSYVITPFGLNVNRARIYGIVMDSNVYKQAKNEANIDVNRKDYAYVVLDDGTETIRIKAWGDDIHKQKIDELSVGDNVDVIGRVREYQDEIYIMPEMILKINDPNWELIRHLENIELQRLFKEKRILNDIDVSEPSVEPMKEIPKKDIIEPEMQEDKELKMIKIKDLTPSSKKVNLIGKCVELGEIREVAGNKRVMEVKFADETGVVILTVWNEAIEKMKEGESYKIINGYTSVYQEKIQLNAGKYGKIGVSKQKVELVNMENTI